MHCPAPPSHFMKVWKPKIHSCQLHHRSHTAPLLPPFSLCLSVPPPLHLSILVTLPPLPSSAYPSPIFHSSPLPPLSISPPPLFLLLSSTGLVDIVYGSGPHVVVLTSQGELYSCGHNSYGQLGHGCTSVTGQGMSPRCIVEGIAGVRITKVACGGHHTLALGPQGEVGLVCEVCGMRVDSV